MRFTRVFKIGLIVILFVALLAGIIWVLDFFAIINANKTLQSVPLLGKVIYVPEGDKDKIKKPLDVEQTPAEKENLTLKDENRQLKDQIKELKAQQSEISRQLELANKEKQGLVDEKNSLTATVESLQNAKSQQDSDKLSFETLGKYYAEMKPQSAVKIMDNLSDDVIIGIFQNLEDDQVAEILSKMDPKRAAALVNEMK